MLDWQALKEHAGQRWLALHRELLALRARDIVPHLTQARGGQAQFDVLGAHALMVRWPLGDGSLALWANLADAAVAVGRRPQGRLLWATPGADAALSAGTLPAWCAAWYLDEATAAASVAATHSAEPEPVEA